MIRLFYLDGLSEPEKLVSGSIAWFLPARVIAIGNESFSIGVWRRMDLHNRFARDDIMVVRLSKGSGFICPVEEIPGFLDKILEGFVEEEVIDYTLQKDSVWWSRVLGKRKAYYYLVQMMYDPEEDEVFASLAKASEPIIIGEEPC
ncbi:MAG: hypothetical protein GXX80_13990 [Thermotogaceae bacterium]|nr:hypothetical protein [Thermotogaceae bacterium]